MKTIILIVLIPVISFSQGWFIQTTFSPAQSLQLVRFVDANTGYTSAPLYNGSNFNIHKTTNGGFNWSVQNSGFTSMRWMAIWCITADTVFMGGNNGRIIRTVNGGTNWILLNTNDTVTQYWGIQFVNSFTGFAAGSAGKILKTTDRGATWNQSVTGIQNALSNIHFRNETTGYVSGGSIIIKTTDAGASWFPLSAPYIGFETIRDISFTDDNNGIAVSDAGRVLKTTNAGANWSLIPSGTGESLFGLYFTDANTAFACGNNGAIIRTTNAGANWSSQTSPLTEILTDIWFTNSSTGFISTWSGKILKTTNGGITFISTINSEIPESFKLEQNYPNPFNPVTHFEFRIADFGFIDLTIYDAAGRKVEVLVNENLNAGTYEVTWDASKYASGVYFYTLQSGNFIQTKTMLMIK